MAESIFIHFSLATWGDLTPWLDMQSVRSGPRLWHYPEADYTLLLYEYPDLRTEYEAGEIERLRTLLGGMPSLSLCLELRRSQGNRACDAAESLSMDLLRSFPGVADDAFDSGGYWTLADLEAGVAISRGRFLDCYRVESQDP